MRPIALSQIASWCEGRLIGDDRQITSICTDSRTLKHDDLFIALRGERFDGHDHVTAAQAAGAAALLVSRPVKTNLPQILCADTQEALGEIAASIQQGRPAIVIALTGSNGKTSVKTLTYDILMRAGIAYANPGNRNNEIGLPLAVLDAPEDAQFAIYEMGAGKLGDIAYLCSIVSPNVALVNNIGPAHIERMGSLTGIAQTKGAIYEALSDDGVAIVNADDAFAPYFMQRIGARRVLRFGIENDADISARKVIDQIDSSRFMLHTPAGAEQILLPLPGRHNVMNALAASALALAAGAPLSAIVDGLHNAQAVKGRQQQHIHASGAIVIDDSYNANPASVSAAITTLASAEEEAWLVLGDMAELGPDALSMHAQIGAQARNAGIAQLWTLGTLSRAAAEAFGEQARTFVDHQSLATNLAIELRAGVRCLIKGSRSSAMDRIVQVLIKYEQGASDAA